MRAAPPGHEGIGVSRPALLLEKRCCDLDQPALHIDDRAVLVEHADLHCFLDVLEAHGVFPWTAFRCGLRRLDPIILKMDLYSSALFYQSCAGGNANLHVWPGASGSK